MSLTMRFGDRPCFFSTLTSNRFGWLGIAAGLDNLVENAAVLVNGTPKTMFRAADGNRHLVQISDILL